MIQPHRITHLNDRRDVAGAYVLYWMQASQRTSFNHALEYAIIRADELKKPIVVYFGIADGYLEAQQRHYYFMLEGIMEVKERLAERGIQLVIRQGSPELGVVEMARDAALLVMDRGYLRMQRMWREYAASRVECPCVQVETDAIVPVDTASGKEEFSAATFRPKISQKLFYFMIPLDQRAPCVESMGMEFAHFPLRTVDEALARVNVPPQVQRVSSFHGGTSHAEALLKVFLQEKIHQYASTKNEPAAGMSSDLSPYIHFGQISPLQVALEVIGAGQDSLHDPVTGPFLEELVVRRELSLNFVTHNPYYDSLESLPGWALTTLREHERDRRDYRYGLEDLEHAHTHDAYWNAAQMEMVKSGKMHGYMRMYWGKKIIEWCGTPTEAYRTALYLNDKYELDGRDPNGYAGVAWCFGKHDRPWKERGIFGKVRYMNDRGLERKFDMGAYVKKIGALGE